MRLNDKTVVVTGASSGLGKAMADAFVREGARVVYSSRSERRLTAAVDQILDENGGGEATVVPADVRSWDDVKQLVRRARDVYGDVDVFVNNAGVTQSKVTADHTSRPTQDVPITAWDAILNTNLRCAFLCTKAVLPEMRSRDSGRVIHISSGHGVAGRKNRAPYVASKFGLEGFHESLALELEDTGVDSIALRPPDGGVYTESSERYGRTRESYAHESPTVIAEAAVRLAAGDGENGGRYKATPDGEGFVDYSRAER
jgi:3-oxoacyl-[acyl-carrier protein] reductase